MTLMFKSMNIQKMIIFSQIIHCKYLFSIQVHQSTATGLAKNNKKECEQSRKKSTFSGPVLIQSVIGPALKLVSQKLIHFGVIARLFWQIGGHSSRFVLFCSFCRLFTIKMIKSVKVFPFSFLKIITNLFYFIKFKPPA